MERSKAGEKKRSPDGLMLGPAVPPGSLRSEVVDELPN